MQRDDERKRPFRAHHAASTLLYAFALRRQYDAGAGRGSVLEDQDMAGASGVASLLWSTLASTLNHAAWLQAERCLKVEG
jgi:hypothetical protein